MPMEPMWIQPPDARRPGWPPACERCHSTNVRDLGLAGSNLQWFACQTCSWVWSTAAEEVPDFRRENPASRG
jgi:hypothetical protein